MRRETAMQWLAVLITMLLVTAIGALVVLHANDRAIATVQQSRAESRRTLCKVIIATDDALNDPGNPPPATDRGRDLAKAWHLLRQDFRCDAQ